MSKSKPSPQKTQHKPGMHETDAQWYFRNNGKVRGK